jgi:ATP-dependent Clp protease ATP-binding subunit ClpA
MKRVIVLFTALFAQLPWYVQLVLFGIIGFFLVKAWSLLYTLLQGAGWLWLGAALGLWMVVFLGYLHAAQQLPKFLQKGWLMRSLHRLTNDLDALKAGLENRSPSPSTRLINAEELEQKLRERVFGQDAVCRDVAGQIRERFARDKRETPIGVFLLVGPPGTGKTWFARMLSEAIYGENSLLFFPMGQYSEPHSASGLFGVPPGYAGSDKLGELTGALQTKPDRVILLDEFTRAHPSLHEKFLTAWNEGFATDISNGQKVLTTDALFILTTNAAHREIASLVTQYASDRDGLSDACKRALRGHINEAALDRVDRVFPFLPLRGIDLAYVIAQQIESGVKAYGIDIAEKGLDYRVLLGTIEQAAKRGVEDYREIRRMLERTINPQLVDLKERGVKAVRLIQDDDGVKVIPA